MKKENKGITLIALTITIIVILILAGVTVVTLTGDNGLLTKAKSAVDKYSKGEICEQIKLAYLECQTEKLYNSNINDVEFLTNTLKEKFNDNTLVVKVDNGKVTLNMTVKNESKTYIYNTNTGVAFEYVDPFYYGEGKTKTTLLPEDDITLVTERFKVISNTNKKIFAMPYYNLVTVNADGTVKQGPAASGKSKEINTAFATEKYWTTGEDAIDMSDSRNNIQKYIDAYKTTLENMGAERITVRVAKYSELSASGVTDYMRNPGQTGLFWLGSGNSNNTGRVWRVENGGNISSNGYDVAHNVRPIIIIEY